MLKEIFQLLKGQDPDRVLLRDFERMLELAKELILQAGEVFWGRAWSPEERSSLYAKDVEINRLQRDIRRRLVARLVTSTSASNTHALVLMSLVKDVERLGDYAKNLAEVPNLVGAPMPDDELAGELREIHQAVEGCLVEVPGVLEASEVDRAKQLNAQGRNTCKRCDALIQRVARSEHRAPEAVALVLGGRYYKRIQSHLLNLLSSVIMPLHKLDYFDEDALRESS